MNPKFDPQAYWQKRLEASYNLKGVGYLRLGQAYNGWLYRLRGQIFLQTVRQLKLDLPGQTVLDIGSGTGFYIERWLELRVRRLSGMDITRAAVEALRRKYPQLNFYQADISQNLGQEHRHRYDLVSIMDVLFHIIDDQDYRLALQNLAACLTTDGWLILSENFLHGEQHAGEHQVSRRLEEIENWLDDAGLEIVSRRPMFYWMNAPLDSRGPLLKIFWKGLAWLVARGEIFGYLAGVLLYPLERLSLRLAREGPSTEIMVCRLRPNTQGVGSADV